MRLRQRQYLDALSRDLDRRRDREAERVDKRVLGRNTDGTTRALPLVAKGCEQRGGITALQAGQITSAPAGPDYSRRGQSGSTTLTVSGAAADPWIESLSPNVYAPGDSVTATVRGQNLTDDLQLAFGRRSGRYLNRDISITEIRVTSATSAEVDLVVVGDAKAIEAGALFYGRNENPSQSPTRLQGRLGNAYAIEIPSTIPAYLHGYTFGEVWTAFEIARDGAVLETLGTLDNAELGLNPPTGPNTIAARSLSPSAIAWLDGSTLRSWDPATGNTYSYTVPAPYVSTPPVEIGGLLYWVEMAGGPIAPPVMRLRQSTAHLLGPNTVRTVDLDPDATGLAFNITPKLIAAFPSAVLAAGFWETLDFVEGVSTCLLPFSQAGQANDENDPIGSVTVEERSRMHLNPADGLAYGPVYNPDESDSTIRKITESENAGAQTAWPSSGAWAIGPRVYSHDLKDGAALIYADHPTDGRIVHVSGLVETYGPAPDLTIVPPPADLIFFGA